MYLLKGHVGYNVLNVILPKKRRMTLITLLSSSPIVQAVQNSLAFQWSVSKNRLETNMALGSFMRMLQQSTQASLATKVLKKTFSLPKESKGQKEQLHRDL